MFFPIALPKAQKKLRGKAFHMLSREAVISSLKSNEHN